MLSIQNLCVSLDGSRILARRQPRSSRQTKSSASWARNGVGKTTTLKSIVGIHRPTSGGSFFKGENISQLPTGGPRAKAGIRLRPAGARNFPAPDRGGESLHRSHRAGQEAEALAGAACTRCFPSSRTSCRERAACFPGGQQQQLAIGRALLTGAGSPDPRRTDRGHPAEHHRPDRRRPEASPPGRAPQRAPALMAEAVQLIKKLQRGGNFPETRVARKTRRGRECDAARGSAAKDSEAFERLSASFDESARGKRPHKGNILGEEIAAALMQLLTAEKP